MFGRLICVLCFLSTDRVDPEKIQKPKKFEIPQEEKVVDIKECRIPTIIN